MVSSERVSGEVVGQENGRAAGTARGAVVGDSIAGTIVRPPELLAAEEGRGSSAGGCCWRCRWNGALKGSEYLFDGLGGFRPS